MMTPNSSNDSRFRRGLPGLLESGKPPTTPLEVLTLTYDGLQHIVKKQTGAVCVNGMDKWWVETSCRKQLVVTTASVKPSFPTCMECMMEG
jgi:hypothetical protein